MAFVSNKEKDNYKDTYSMTSKKPKFHNYAYSPVI